jgi:hypothetical protein
MSEKDSKTAESAYWQQHTIMAQGIDQYAEFIKSEPNSRWGDSLIKSWPEAIEKIIADAQANSIIGSDIEIALHILETGEYNEVRVDIDDVLRVRRLHQDEPMNSVDERMTSEAFFRRLIYADLALYDSGTLAAMHKGGVNALHGTQAIALPSVLRSGALLSHAKQKELTIATGSGEVHPAPFRRDFVSFASIQSDIASGYSERDLRSLYRESDLSEYAHLFEGYALRLSELRFFNEQLRPLLENGNEFLKTAESKRFGIQFGLSRSAFWMCTVDPTLGDRVRVISDIKEAAFVDQVPLKYTTVIFAPSEFMKLTQSEAGGDIEVLSSEVLDMAISRSIDVSRAVSKK